jgi:hypothetical protein
MSRKKADPYRTIRAHNIGMLDAIGIVAGQLMTDYGKGITAEQRAKLLCLISGLKRTEHAADEAIRPVAAGRRK